MAALWGGASILAGGSLEEPATAVQQAGPTNGIPSAGTGALTEASEAQTIARTGLGATDAETITPALQTLIAGQKRNARPASAARVVSQASAPALRITPAPAEELALAADTASVVAPSPPAIAESPATAATLREFRSAMDESRDAVRQVIRLGSRQRPARDASAEELSRYRLRQQNAEAARGYRNYLDTLARSMRGSTSEEVARQSLERARQTLGYLTTMLADSQASLR